MELIKLPVPVRDFCYKTGAILSFPSLPWIQPGLRESTREAPGASPPNLLPAPRSPFGTRIPQQTDSGHRLLPEVQH